MALINQLLAGTERPRVKLLTFTRAATAELAKKVSEPGAAAERPSTIHSFAISVLLRNPGSGDFPEPLRIADDWEYERLIRPTLARRAGVHVPKLDRLIREMAANWESLQPEKDPKVIAAERARFLGAWREHREVLGYTLLSELPYALRRALQDHPDLKGVDYNLLIVDEYQDLNACDLEALRLIAARGCSVIAAGDDDQSIYSFRRAAPAGIRRFPDDYPGAADYPLSVTQRCGSRILEWATYVIEGDPDRPSRRPRLRSAEGSPPGEVALMAFDNENQEAQGVALLVQRLIEEEKVPAREILILLRGDYRGTFSNPIKRKLDRLGISYSDPDMVKRILEEPPNRGALETMRLLVHREDSLAWAGLLTLTDGVGDAFFGHVYELARARRVQFGRALLEAYEKGFPEAPAVSARRAADLMKAVLSWLDEHAQALEDDRDEGWGKWICDVSGGDIVPTPTEELQGLMTFLDDVVEKEQGLGRYLGQITPLGKDLALAESIGVRVMSMSGAKGLTVQATIIVAAEEGIVPRPDADLGEERRLLYVGMTRARRFVYVTWARRRRGPTARSGAPRVGTARRHSSFLDGGSVSSADGMRYIREHWPT